jgi:hypothetical protein
MDEKISIPAEEHFLQHQHYHQQISESYLVVHSRLHGHFDTLIGATNDDLRDSFARIAEHLTKHLHKRARVHDALVHVLQRDFATFHEQDASNAHHIAE